MRVITGSQKGKRLSAPPGTDVRPTPERVKEGIFSALQFDLEGRRVLDLFAGSGQLGLEALSRGAGHCVFVDNSPISLKSVKSNIESCRMAEKSRVVQSDFSEFCASCKSTFDYAFLDPPYAAGLLMPAVRAVAPLMSAYGAIICEHPLEVQPDRKAGEFYIHKTYRYGKVYVSVYRKGEPHE